MILQAVGLDQALCDNMEGEKTLAEKTVHFLANYGAPYGLQSLWPTLVFLLGTVLTITGLSLSHNQVEFLKWLLPSSVGLIILVQSLMIGKIVRLGEKYGEDEALVYRGVIGAVVISTWISITKTVIEFYLQYGGVAN
jgi:hypothetical protein